MKTFCHNCGPDVSVDEDALCVSCGSTAWGPRFEEICLISESDSNKIKRHGVKGALEAERITTRDSVVICAVGICEKIHDNYKEKSDETGISEFTAFAVGASTCAVVIRDELLGGEK